MKQNLNMLFVFLMAVAFTHFSSIGVSARIFVHPDRPITEISPSGERTLPKNTNDKNPSSNKTESSPCFKNAKTNSSDTYPPDQLFEYLELAIREEFDPYYFPRPHSFDEMRFPLNFSPDSTAYRQGYVIENLQHDYQDQWELFVFDHPQDMTQFDTNHTILQTQQGEEGYKQEQLKDIWKNHVTFACNRNLLLVYADVQTAWHGKDKQEWKDQKLLDYFKGFTPEKLSNIHEKQKIRQEKLKTISQWVESELLKDIDYPRNDLQGFPYPKFGDEDFYYSRGSRWDELAHGIDESIEMLKDLRDKLKRRGSEWAMPHQIPHLVNAEEWDRVIELSKYTTGGRYGGFKTFKTVYELSEKSDFENPSLKTMAKFLSKLHSSEVPRADTETIKKIEKLATGGQTEKVINIRIFENLAIADQYTKEGGARLYFFRKNGVWKNKGSLYGWIY